jgi:hypothetical protein
MTSLSFAGPSSDWKRCCAVGQIQESINKLGMVWDADMISIEHY